MGRLVTTIREAVELARRGWPQPVSEQKIRRHCRDKGTYYACPGLPGFPPVFRSTRGVVYTLVLNQSTDPALSCVLDDTPGIWSSFSPWLATATELSRIVPSQIIVHHVAVLPDDVASLCKAVGVRTLSVQPFDRRSAHSNKIRQLETDFGPAGRILLTDVDIVFSAPLPLDQITAPVAGKLVDGPNPPSEVLEAVFAHSGVRRPEVCTGRVRHQDVTSEFHTFLGNFNGGLYLIDKECAGELGRRWEHWARWLLHRVELLGEWRVHVDQVSFCLAVGDLELDATGLDDRWNYPTHTPAPPIDAEPYVLHHHGRLDSHQRVIPIDGEAPRRAIERVNRSIEEFQRRHFDNHTFWNHRYAYHADLGSGSRGEILELKRGLLSGVVPQNDALSVLDWGCGDLEVVKAFPWSDYCGVDVSSEVLRIARRKRPDWGFATPEEFDGAQRDLVICFDVLIHQPTPEAYRTLVDKLVSLMRIGLLIAAYDGEPGVASHITYFHEPLRETLTGRRDVERVIRLTEYGDTVVYFVAKRLAEPSSSDDLRSPNSVSDPLAAAHKFLKDAKG